MVKEIIGYKGRIGILVPYSNVATEYEFNKMAPEGVSIHAARLGQGEDRKYLSSWERVTRYSENVESLVRKLLPVKVSVICYACTSGSFLYGLEWERDLNRRMERASEGVPTITTTSAVLDAITELKLKKISVATPYGEDFGEETNNRLFKLIKDATGAEIFNYAILKLDREVSIHREGTNLDNSYRLAKEVYRPESDGIFIPCTGFRAVENIERLEKETGQPVFSSNSASMWKSLKEIGYREPVMGYGHLLTKL